jgi:nitrogen fixation/metabolism regulation signal transduction histidine kinase
MATKKNRRKNLLVQPEIQKRIIVGFTLVPLLCLGVSSLLVAAFSSFLAEEALRSEVELTWLTPLFLSIVAFVLVSSGVTLFQALKHSHKIAGPTCRIINSLREISGGNRKMRIQLRQDDYLTEIVDEINLMLDSMQEEFDLKENALRKSKDETFEIEV